MREALYKRYNTHLSERQIRGLDAIAKRREMRTSEVLREAINKYLEAWERKMAESNGQRETVVS